MTTLWLLIFWTVGYPAHAVMVTEAQCKAALNVETYLKAYCISPAGQLFKRVPNDK